jgi:hypothetical protein
MTPECLRQIASLTTRNEFATRNPKPMTDDIHYPDGTETHPDDHQHAIEACEHATDALENGDLAYARTLLEEAHTAVERAQHDDTATQEQREIAYDCYD